MRNNEMLQGNITQNNNDVENPKHDIETFRHIMFAFTMDISMPKLRFRLMSSPLLSKMLIAES